MQSKGAVFTPNLLHPRLWSTWLLFGLWRAVTILPFPVLLKLGTALGLLLHSIPNRRRTIAHRNIQLCFPNLSDQEQRAMLRANFISTGIAVMEVGYRLVVVKKKV